MLGICLLLLFFYLLAIFTLPERIHRRFLFTSTFLFGIICVLTPVVTSQDIFSYVIYARMAIIYHLNPLTATPLAIPNDPAYPHLYWIDQPSAYGPTWILLTCALQWLVNLSGYTDIRNVALMIVFLRLLGLAAHLGSVWLVWTIGGELQQKQGRISSRTRMQAALAFAWNPLLLFEACVNVHNDTIMLFFILLAIWSLVRQTPRRSVTYALTTIMLALATALKVNIVLLVPGFFLFLWTQPQRWRLLSGMLAVYMLSLLTLYLPFWQGGAILKLLSVNPGTYRNINSIAEFLSRLINSLAHFVGAPVAEEIGSPAENILHTLSLVFFLGSYGLLCWLALFSSLRLTTPIRMIRWMTLAWFLYCVLGTPWFWPWYAITFFGLFALLAMVDRDLWQKQPFLHSFSLSVSVPIFAFSLLSLYCFYTWVPYSTMIPGIDGFRWAYLRGLWTWGVLLIPLGSLALQRRSARLEA
ncbi:glycosyltransferase family 39 protein [Tengunoibacter tsumagoiensis]|uniref:Uncharacterized protein n=1 Tax=Tengunoibacter tsumagoiensis TaxID=2014871 RepID=A0A402A2Q0_9CHLR|nr:glycosyltransferase family 39 protein [Tengunoibacter tsumagoiensis]GCE13329.1 hypothetical protein KTT_31880 [Tengunoibacter tsumagoiensis]